MPPAPGVIFRLELGAALCQGDSGKSMTIQEKPRLVVVDDEASLREMLADYLGKHGFDVAFKESAGAHTWTNWREYLDEFAPQLFQ